MIRVASLNDVDDINKLGILVNKHFEKLFHIETEVNNKLAIVLVNYNANELNGFLYALDLGDNIDLLMIVVDKDKRGKGIGTELMNHLINNYCHHEKNIILEVAVTNESALKLYEKCGFKIINIRKGYYNGVDAYIMRR